ncbi:hypothetical protein WMF04_20580 [Sorangium sp. So ce260]|uniref:hypothetical protein n=1 Tax=Sorangium sp. So ce260 TaxID=3133291 RepID=UPI003F6473C3
MRRLAFLSLAVTALLHGAACSGDDDAPGASNGGTGGAGAASATTTTTSGGGSSAGGGGEGGQGGGTGTGGAGGAGTGGAGGTGAGGAGTGGATYGYCAKGCTTPADCCAPGQGNCPSDSYPNNYTCDNGICGAPQCASHNDCTNGGLDPTKQCVPSGGVNGCVTPCTLDTDCPGTSKCIGTDDTGNKFCRIESEPFVCTRTEECAGFGECVNGACVCDDDGDCTDPSANACAL